MPMLDIFKDDAFGLVSLTDAINNLEFEPGRLGELGLFSETAVATKTIAIEERNGILSLVGPTPRGGPGNTLDKAKRTVRSVEIPHFQIDDTIMADEVQDVRAWGSEGELETVASKIGERDVALQISMSATQEYSRIGAFKGLITYKNGDSLDLFDLFGVSQLAEVDFDLDNPTPTSGALRKKCAGVVRAVANELGGLPYRGLLAECGDAFFDDLLGHPEVVDSYKNTSMASVLRDGYVLPGNSKIYGAFEFGGIVWENYRGAVEGTSFIDTDKCHIAPLGVPGLFRTVYGPPDINGYVNTMGQRLFQRQYELPNGKGVNLETQMNALEYCTRPRTLIKGKRT